MGLEQPFSILPSEGRTWIDINADTYLTAKLLFEDYPNVTKASIRVYISYSDLKGAPNERLRENVVARYTPATNDGPRIQHARLPGLRTANDYHQQVHSSLIAHQEFEIRVSIVNFLVEIVKYATMATVV